MNTRSYIARRSESDILTGAPIVVHLGGKDYSIPILNNRKAAKWREKLFATLGPLVQNVDFTGVDLNANHAVISETMSATLSKQMISFPERLVELFLDYANNDELRADVMSEESSITDEQIARAFAQVSEVGYPFFFHLLATQTAMAMQAEAAVAPPSPASIM